MRMFSKKAKWTKRDGDWRKSKCLRNSGRLMGCNRLDFGRECRKEYKNKARDKQETAKPLASLDDRESPVGGCLIVYVVIPTIINLIMAISFLVDRSSLPERVIRDQNWLIYIMAAGLIVGATILFKWKRKRTGILLLATISSISFLIYINRPGFEFIIPLLLVYGIVSRFVFDRWWWKL